MFTFYKYILKYLNYFNNKFMKSFIIFSIFCSFIDKNYKIINIIFNNILYYNYYYNILDMHLDFGNY